MTQLPLPALANAILATLGEAVLVVDDARRIVFANPAAGDVLGQDETSLNGVPMADLVGGRDANPGLTALWDHLAADGSAHAELEAIAADGTRHAIEVLATAAILPGLHLLRLRDARSRAERDAQRVDVAQVEQLVDALESSEARYRTLIDEIDGIVYLSDMRTGVNFCSDKVRDILGFEPEQMEQDTFWHDQVVEEDRARMVAFWGDYDSLELTDARYRMRRADGRIVWVEERWRPVMGPDGTPVRWCALVTDVTHRRASEEALARADRLDAVSRLAAAAAHDFGNVLMAIGMAQGGLEALTPQDDERYVEVAAIGEAVRRGRSLTRQMMAFGRDPGESEPEVVDPLALTLDMAGMLRSVAIPAELVVEPHHAGPVLVRRRALEQAVLNLVINARDAMAPHGGRITVTTGLEALQDDTDLGLPAGPYVRLSIEDNGPGMTAEVREHALEPFFTTKPDGTGLGLAGVHASMRKSGGTVRLGGQEGVGTCVDLLLPLHAEA